MKIHRSHAGTSLATCLVSGFAATALAADAPPATIHDSFTRGDVRLHYTQTGSGETIVFLSGGPGISGQYFLPLAERSARLARCIVYDQRGTGRSTLVSIDPATMNLAACVADLEALRAHLGVERWVLLGHSWGGMLAMAYAAEHPERLRGLVLVGSGGPDARFTAYYNDNILARLEDDQRLAAAYWVEPERYMRDPARSLTEFTRISARAMVFDRSHLPPLVESTLASGDFVPEVNLLLMQEWVLQKVDLTSRLGKVKAPALVVHGRQDPIGESTAFQVRAALPGARLEFVERCGHWPFVEQPERFDALLAEFVRGLPPAGR